MGKDINGNMWLAGFDGSVYRFDGTENSFTALNNARLLNDGYLTERGEVLTSTNYFLSDGTTTYPLFDTSKIPAGNILLRPREVLWRNHYRNIFNYDIARRQTGKLLQWNMQFPDSLKVLFPFIIDRSGILWSGSMGYGLRKYNIVGNRYNQHQLAGYSVRWIIADKENTIYAGDVVFQRKLRIGKVKEAILEVPITVSFEACNSEKCLPPTSQTVKASIVVKPKPREESDD